MDAINQDKKIHDKINEAALSPFKFCFFIIRKQPIRSFFLCFFSMYIVLEVTLWPFLYNVLIEKMEYIDKSGSAERWHMLMSVFFMWVGLWVLVEVFSSIAGFLSSKLIPEIERNVRESAFFYIFEHSLNFHVKHYSGVIVAEIEDLVYGVSNIIYSFLTVFVPVVISICISIFIYFYVDHTCALVIVAWLMLHFLMSVFMTKKTSTKASLHASDRSKASGHITKLIMNVFMVKAFAQVKKQLHRLVPLYNKEQKSNEKMLVSMEVMSAFFAVLIILIPGLVITLLVLNDWANKLITIGLVIMILDLTAQLTDIIWNVVDQMPLIAESYGDASNALELLKQKHEVTDDDDIKDKEIELGEISIKNLIFRENGVPVLDNISLEIKAGDHVAFVGNSQKERVLVYYVLTRLYGFESGIVNIQGRPVSTIRKNTLRKSISLASFKGIFFDDTIKNNILFSVDVVNEEVTQKMEDLCDYFGILEDINSQDNGFDSKPNLDFISTDFIRLVQIIRVLILDSAIMVFDNIFHGLSPLVIKDLSEKIFAKLSKNTTVIFVSNKKTVLESVDKVYYFLNGKINCSGPHKECCKNSTTYAGFIDDALL